MELTELSSLELLRLCEGADCWHTRAVPGLGLHALRMADGPHGLRRQERAGDMLGMNVSKRATCFPAFAPALANAIKVEDKVVTDDIFITAEGMGVSFAFGLALITVLYGEAKAEEVRLSTRAG